MTLKFNHIWRYVNRKLCKSSHHFACGFVRINTTIFYNFNTRRGWLFSTAQTAHHNHATSQNNTSCSNMATRRFQLLALFLLAFLSNFIIANAKGKYHQKIWILYLCWPNLPEQVVPRQGRYSRCCQEAYAEQVLVSLQRNADEAYERHVKQRYEDADREYFGLLAWSFWDRTQKLYNGWLWGNRPEFMT